MDENKTNETFLKSKTTRVGNSMYLLLPDEVIEDLNLHRKDTEVRLKVERGKHGKYLSAWNPEQQKSESSERVEG